jgi:lipopolysaccharide export system protein LptC
MTQASTLDRQQRSARSRDSWLGRRRAHREPVLARFAGQLRILVPLAALGLAMAGVILPLIYDSATGFRLHEARIKTDRDSYSTMDKPRFAGIDGQQRPYVITADRALQRVKDDKVYDMVAPKADIVDGKGAWIFVRGDKGRYYDATRQLDVNDNVTMYHDKGHRMEAERARIDIITGNVASDRPVHGFGPSGTVDADGIHVSRRGRMILFTGQTHMIIEDRGKDDSAKAPVGSVPGHGDGG